MYDKILEQASKWPAQFKQYHTGFYRDGQLINIVKKVAHDINQPHEDEHVRTPMTEQLIMELINQADDFQINRETIQWVHYKLFSDELEKPGIVPGYWRTHSVGFDHSDHVPPEAIHIEYLMGHLFSQAHKMTPTSFYRIFQTIHPFSDGNGRVGGIILAVSSWNMYNDGDDHTMFAPCQ